MCLIDMNDGESFKGLCDRFIVSIVVFSFTIVFIRLQLFTFGGVFSRVRKFNDVCCSTCKTALFDIDKNIRLYDSIDCFATGMQWEKNRKRRSSMNLDRTICRY